MTNLTSDISPFAVISTGSAWRFVFSAEGLASVFLISVTCPLKTASVFQKHGHGGRVRNKKESREKNTACNYLSHNFYPLSG